MNRVEPTEFWRWAYSDFLSNTLRGVLAEYVVARALECTHAPRREWHAYDLVTSRGCRVEVKSAAYLQAWEQKTPSAIRFDIGRKRGWDADTNITAAEATRSADVYVFCVFAATEKPADPLDLAHWFFLVRSAREIDSRFGNQKSVALSSLERAGGRRVVFDQLREAVNTAVADGSVSRT